MGAHRENIRAQLRESCRVKQSFSDELLARIETFAERSAEALARGGKTGLLRQWRQRRRRPAFGRRVGRDVCAPTARPRRAGAHDQYLRAHRRGQ